MMNMYGLKSKRISRFYFQQTGTYDKQYRRAYSLSIDDKLINQLEEAVVTSTKLNPSEFAHPTKQLISQSAQPEQSISIINGFDTPRLRFWMEIESIDQLDNSNVTVVMGYTDHADLSMGGMIDPRTTFFINNVMRTRRHNAVTPIGNQMRTNVLTSEQLIVDTDYHSGGGVFNPQRSTLMTPARIFDRMRTSDIQMAAAEYYGSGSGSFLVDTTVSVNNRPTYNQRAHNLGSTYAADILNTFIGTRLSSKDSGQDVDPESFFRDCKNQVVTNSYEQDCFLSFLNSRKSGFLSSASNSGPNTFKLEDLAAFDPGYFNVMKQIDDKKGLSHAGMSANWGYSTPEATFAANLATSVAGLMTSQGFHRLGFQATNGAYMSAQHEVLFNTAYGVSGQVGAGPELTAFRHRLEHEVLNVLSYGNQLGYEVYVTCDMAGETWIKLRLNGGEEELYVTPTFCDALMAPVTTLDEKHACAVASSLHDLGSQLTAAKLQSQRSPSIMSMGASTTFSNTPSVFGGSSSRV